MILRGVVVLARIVFWAAALVLAVGMFGRVGMDRPQKTGGDGRLRLGMSWLGISLIWVALAWILLSIHSLHHSKSWFAQKWFDLPTLVLVGVVAMELLAETPGTVVIGDSGIEQVYWIRRNRRIQWKEIEEVQSGPKDRTIRITAKGSTWIAHNAFLSGRSRLLAELKQHCGDELPPDFPREPAS